MKFRGGFTEGRRAIWPSLSEVGSPKLKHECDGVDGRANLVNEKDALSDPCLEIIISA